MFIKEQIITVGNVVKVFQIITVRKVVKVIKNWNCQWGIITTAKYNSVFAKLTVGVCFLLTEDSKYDDKIN